MALQSPVALTPSSESQHQQTHHHHHHQQQPRQAQVFEFTKRKKWADILISELPDTVALVLDTGGQIQYVAPNATDVLGWEVEELSETDVFDIINDVDKRTFNDHLQKSLSSRQDLSCYARLKCKPIGKSSSEQSSIHNSNNNSNKELLFEIRGHGLYLPDDNECKCFLLVAKPYPSRNMAVLNTFLELKIENERLTQRLKDLKAQQDVIPSGVVTDLPLSASHQPFHNNQNQNQNQQPQFATFEFPTNSLTSRDGAALQSPSTASSTTGSFSTSTMQAGGHGHGFVHSTGVPGTNAITSSRDEEVEEGGKKRKQKKGNGQQYVCVTCGRTDSPEWRKGPRGPKTLCNACGLRWAKRSKRTDDVPIPYVQSQQQTGSHEGGGGDGNSPPSGSSGGGGRSTRGPGAPVPNAALSVTPPTEMMRSPTTSQHQSQGQSQSRQNQAQNQHQQSRYENAVPQQVPTPSPTHATFSQSQPQPQSQSQGQSQSQSQSQMPAVNTEHYVFYPTMHSQGTMQTQPSPTSSSHPHAHGYPMHTHAHNHPHPDSHSHTQSHIHDQAQAQTQAHVQQQASMRQDHYQAVYEQYHWPAGQHHQHHGGEGTYGY